MTYGELVGTANDGLSVTNEGTACVEVPLMMVPDALDAADLNRHTGELVYEPSAPLKPLADWLALSPSLTEAGAEAQWWASAWQKMGDVLAKTIAEMRCAAALSGRKPFPLRALRTRPWDISALVE